MRRNPWRLYQSVLKIIYIHVYVANSDVLTRAFICFLTCVLKGITFNVMWVHLKRLKYILYRFIFVEVSSEWWACTPHTFKACEEVYKEHWTSLERTVEKWLLPAELSIIIMRRTYFHFYCTSLVPGYPDYRGSVMK